MNWRTEKTSLHIDTFETVSRNRRTSEVAIQYRSRDSFIAAEGVVPDWSALAVTGDDTLGGLSDEEKGLQNRPFSVEHFIT
jgi:hypothetical protein